MRRTAAGTAATLFAALAIGGPLAGAASAAPATLRCAVTEPAAACELLDDLSAQLGPIAPILGTDLAPLVSAAHDFAARSDSSAGVPSGEVVRVSTALLDALDGLPGRVEALLGTAVLGDLTGTLEDLVAELSQPVASDQESAGTTTPTPARTAAPAPTAARSSDTTSFGASASTSTNESGSAPSGSEVPDVPVGDPLRLSPLGMPDFAFDQGPEATQTADLAPPLDEAEIALAEAADALRGDGRGAELGVVVALSLLLIAGAGVAHLQAQRQRHTIPEG